MRLRTLAAAIIVSAAAVGGGAWAYARVPALAPLALGAQADRIVVSKSANAMTLYQGNAALRTYRVSIGGGGAGPKRREGDRKTPEGAYRISTRNPQSVAHLSLRISYPGPADVARAAPEGVPPGSDIMIHGLMNGYGWIGRLHRLINWTDGCIAVTNDEMDEIWRVVPDGAAVEIRT